MKKLLIFTLFISLCLCINASTYAEIEKTSISFFDKRTDYDIFFHSAEDHTSVLQHVEIVRFEEIAGKLFVVVRSASFDLKDREGFILFDSISAILPDRNFKVEHHKRKVRY